MYKNRVCGFYQNSVNKISVWIVSSVFNAAPCFWEILCCVRCFPAVIAMQFHSVHLPIPCGWAIFEGMFVVSAISAIFFHVFTTVGPVMDRVLSGLGVRPVFLQNALYTLPLAVDFSWACAAPILSPAAVMASCSSLA